MPEHETIKKEFNLLKDHNESFKKSQLIDPWPIDPCSLANLNQDLLIVQEDSTKLGKRIESVNEQLNSKVKESVSNMEEFLNKRIDETLKDSHFITTNQFDLFKRDTDAKHTQITSSFQELLERNDSKMQELSDNLSKVVTELSIPTPKQTFAELPKPQQNLLPHNIDITNARPTNQSRPQRGLPPIAHPNASNYYDNLTLGNSIVKRISCKLFIKGQSTLKIALSEKGTSDIHHFVNEALQLDKEPKNIFIHVGTNDLNNGISPPKVIEMMNSLTSSIKHKFPNSKVILSSVLSRQNNLSVNSQMNSYNDLLQQFCAKNNFLYSVITAIYVMLLVTLRMAFTSTVLKEFSYWLTTWINQLKTWFIQRTWILSHFQDTNSMKILTDTNKIDTKQT